MKKIQKITTISAIIILVLIIIVGGIFTGLLNLNLEKTAKLVPYNANNVVFIKPKKITSDFYNILKRNPTLLDSISSVKIDRKNVESSFKDNGVNPISDIAIYTFEDSVNYDNYIGIILEVVNYNSFIKYLTTDTASINKIIFKKGIISKLPKEKITILKNNNIVVVLKNLDLDKQVQNNIAENQFNNVFIKDKKTLNSIKPNYSRFIKEENHIGLWLDKKETSDLNILNVIKLNKSLTEKNIGFKAIEKNIELKFNSKMKDVNAINIIPNNSITLHKYEIAKFSLSTTVYYLKNMFEKFINKEHHYILNYCTGAFCTSVIGYKTTPLFNSKTITKIDPQTFSTINALDTVESYPMFNIPDLATAFKISNQNSLFDALNKDTTVQNNVGYWTIPNPYYINEKFYISLKNNILYVSTNKNFERIIPEFTTFSFKTDIQKAIDNYPPKNTIQRLGMTAIPEIKMSYIDLNFNKIENNELYLKGSISTADSSSNHSMLVLAGEILKLKGLLKVF